MSSPNPLDPNISRILEREMQDLFNSGGYVERVASGDLTETILEDHLAPATANEPPDTRSQMISYRDRNNNEVARVHQYVRPDGTIGASGKPDPKRLFHNGILYRLLKKRDRVKSAESS